MLERRIELFHRVGFIVTTLTGTNRAVVRFYDQRGTPEQWCVTFYRLFEQGVITGPATY